MVAQGGNFKSMYWSFRHMLIHHAIGNLFLCLPRYLPLTMYTGGCNFKGGDVIASGTISASVDDAIDVVVSIIYIVITNLMPLHRVFRLAVVY